MLPNSSICIPYASVCHAQPMFGMSTLLTHGRRVQLDRSSESAKHLGTRGNLNELAKETLPGRYILRSTGTLESFKFKYFPICTTLQMIP